MDKIDECLVMDVFEKVGAEKCELFFRWCMEHAYKDVKATLEREYHEHYSVRYNSTFKDGFGTAYNVAIKELRALTCKKEE